MTHPERELIYVPLCPKGKISTTELQQLFWQCCPQAEADTAAQNLSPCWVVLGGAEVFLELKGGGGGGCSFRYCQSPLAT